MLFGNGAKLSFFSVSTPSTVMILPSPLRKVSLTFLLLYVACFFLAHRKATL